MPHPPHVVRRLLNQRARLRMPLPSPAVPESNAQKVGSADSSDGYDTDLDYEKDLSEALTRQERKKKLDRGIGLAMYESVCEKTAAPLQTGIASGLLSDRLKVPERQLGPTNVTGLACALLSNATLKQLDLSSNSLGFNGGKEVITALFTNGTITRLNLANNQLGGNGTSALLAKLLITNRHIVHMALSHNGFNDDDARFLACGIERNDCVQTLDLSHNEFHQPGAEILGRAIAAHDAVLDLNLSWNHIRKKGAVSFGTALKRNWVMKKLNLSWNGFAYEGALAMREALRSNHHLVEVDVSNNRINWEGAWLLAEALEANCTLQILRAGNNPLTTTGCLDIIDGLSRNSNSALILLDLTAVPVIWDFDVMSKSIAERRPAFKVIHGGIVQLHDVLGQRTARKIHPMQKILNYMYQKEIRPVELLRGFDKDVKFQLTFDEFVEKLRAVGIDIRSWEEDELKEYIMSSGMSTQRIDYKMLVESVTDHVEKERNHRISQREKSLTMTNFQLRILNNVSNGLPPLNIDQVVAELTGAKDPAESPSHVGRKVVADSVNERTTNTFTAKMALAKNIKLADAATHVTPHPAARPGRQRAQTAVRTTSPTSERLWMTSSLGKVEVRSAVDGSLVKRRRPKSTFARL